jgi:hypothetical protein
MASQTQTQVITVMEWSGPTIYYGREIEVHLYDKTTLSEIPPTRQGGNKNVVVWELKPGKYILLDIEHPTIITPSYDYTIVCLDASISPSGVRIIERTTLARVSLPKDMDRELRENIILTLMKQLQSMC